MRCASSLLSLFFPFSLPAHFPPFSPCLFFYAFDADISRLLLPHPKGVNPSTSMLGLGGSLVAQPGYQSLVLKSLKEDFGVVFGFGCEHVADAARDGAMVLALKG